MNVLQPLGAVGVVAAALALAACDDGAGDGQARAALPPPTVTVANPLVMPITEWYEFTGRFEATESVDVRARVSGYLEEIRFEDGQMVEQGQVLFVIDRRPYQAEVEQLEAQVASAGARVDLADAELRRAEQLVNNENISRSTYDQRMQEKRVAEAAQAMAEAALRQANLDIGFTEVRAPITGRISDRRVDIGNLVSGDPNATLLTTIVALDPIHFVFDMSEADYLGFQRAVEEGQLPSARDRSTVVQLRLPGSPRYEALLVPDSAIVADQADKIVLVVTEDGTVEPRAIREGPRYAGGLRIVRRGLEPGDRIVINGLMRARPGAKVDPQPGTIAPPSPEDAVTQG